jgi:cyclophilin family peptidyl-prolyl cis-trans isomerase
MADSDNPSDPGHRTGLPRWMFAGLVIVVLIVLSVRFLYSKVSDDDASDAAVSRNNSSDDTEQEELDRVTTTLADDNVAIDPECPAEDGSSERAVQFTGPPPTCIDPSATYVAEIETTRGDFEITLDPSQAEANVNNFVFLARYSYYEGVGFHRIIPGFVAQAGDPTGPQVGAGDPGYSVEDEPPTRQPYYPLLSVAIANQFPEPDTGSSQFFIVTGEAGEALDPNYSRIGQVTAGEDVVAAIDQTGAPDGSGDPLELTVIEHITITES